MCGWAFILPTYDISSLRHARCNLKRVMRLTLIFVFFMIAACGKLNVRFTSPGSAVIPADDGDGRDHEEAGAEEVSVVSGSASSVSSSPTTPSTTTTTPTSGFIIVPNAGRTIALNSAATVITARVNQKIRFTNNDSVEFVLHCDAGGPMPHWSSGDGGTYPRLKPGESREYQVTNVYDYATSTAKCYRHTGNSAFILYIKVMPLPRQDE